MDNYLCICFFEIYFIDLILCQSILLKGIQNRDFLVVREMLDLLRESQDVFFNYCVFRVKNWR